MPRANAEPPAGQYHGRLRVKKFEPWLLGLAGFLLTWAGFLLGDDGTAASRLKTLVSTIEGLTGFLR